jgi:glycosyltransferase involved in cell wall biosynthesis
LSKAIESVLNQTHPNVEIIVVDDGSADNTKQIANQFKNVIYHYQSNKGLPASRNQGVKISKGAYVLFLDADDYLYPRALEINLSFLKGNHIAQFVSGAYNLIYENSERVVECTNEMTGDCYVHFLHNNYVGVPAAVMYRRRIFDEFLFDESLKSCEDYDLYLRISRKYPVIHHNMPVAAYIKHSSNMSSNFSLMLSTALNVLQRQENILKTPEEKKAYKSGIRFWKKYYSRKLYEAILNAERKLKKNDLFFFWQNNSFALVKILIKYPFI